MQVPPDALGIEQIRRSVLDVAEEGSQEAGSTSSHEAAWPRSAQLEECERYEEPEKCGT